MQGTTIQNLKVSLIL